MHAKILALHECFYLHNIENLKPNLLHNMNTSKRTKCKGIEPGFCICILYLVKCQTFKVEVRESTYSKSLIIGMRVSKKFSR